MAETKRKGLIAEAAILAEATKRGYRVSIPFGEDSPYDLVVERRGILERVQVKHTRSNGRVVPVKCESTNNWVRTRYTPADIDWIAAYDAATGASYFIPASMLTPAGRTLISLRLVPAANRQVIGTHQASDYLDW